MTAFDIIYVIGWFMSATFGTYLLMAIQKDIYREATNTVRLWHVVGGIGLGFIPVINVALGGVGLVAFFVTSPAAGIVNRILNFPISALLSKVLQVRAKNSQR